MPTAIFPCDLCIITGSNWKTNTELWELNTGDFTMKKEADETPQAASWSSLLISLKSLSTSTESPAQQKACLTSDPNSTCIVLPWRVLSEKLSANTSSYCAFCWSGLTETLTAGSQLHNFVENVLGWSNWLLTSVLEPNALYSEARRCVHCDSL